MRSDTFSSDTGVVFDRELWNELCSLHFLDDAPGALVLGPVGVGKTHVATALGHVAIRRRRSTLFTPADQLFRQLKADRLDNSVEAEMRRLTRIELLIIDDFALQSMGPTETADFYEPVVERHQRTATIGPTSWQRGIPITLASDKIHSPPDAVAGLGNCRVRATGHGSDGRWSEPYGPASAVGDWSGPRVDS